MDWGKRMTEIDLAMSQPQFSASAWVAASADVVGDVHLLDDSSVWYAAVLRGDGDSIKLGSQSNVQDGCVIHADPGLPVLIGERVSIGHRAILHGCTVEDDVLVGMGAVLLDGCRIGSGSLIAAGALILEGTVVPPSSLVTGVPGKVRRATTDAERSNIKKNADTYLRLKQRHSTLAHTERNEREFS